MFLNGSTNCTYLNTNTIHGLELTHWLYFSKHVISFLIKSTRTTRTKHLALNFWIKFSSKNSTLSFKFLSEEIKHFPALRESRPPASSNIWRVCRLQAFTALSLCCGCNHFPVTMHAACIFSNFIFHHISQAQIYFNARFKWGLQYSSRLFVRHLCVIMDKSGMHSVSRLLEHLTETNAVWCNSPAINPTFTKVTMFSFCWNCFREVLSQRFGNFGACSWWCCWVVFTGSHWNLFYPHWYKFNGQIFRNFWSWLMKHICVWSEAAGP